MSPLCDCTGCQAARILAAERQAPAPISDDFYRGVAAALTIIAQADEETLFHEIVGACGREHLLRVARKDGVLRLSGFTRYGYRATQTPKR